MARATARATARAVARAVARAIGNGKLKCTFQEEQFFVNVPCDHKDYYLLREYEDDRWEIL